MMQLSLLPSFLLFFIFHYLFIPHSLTQIVPDFTPTFEPSDSPPFHIKEDQAYTFGYLTVLEHRERPEGSTIRLPVYIFKSRSSTPAKDPVILLVGGPGVSNMPNAPYMEYYSYLDDRDLILFEQRGTQFAEPHLSCPEWNEARDASLTQHLLPSEKDSLYVSAANTCYTRWKGHGVDLNAYRTTTIAADVEDLRIALGIEQWNLLTMSYGTKIAQVLMRDYPQGIRSVVMDSALPLEVNYDEESIRNLLAAFDQLFEDCTNDPSCHDSFPNLKQQFYDYLSQLTEAPLELTVLDPKDTTEYAFQLQGKDILNFFDISYTNAIPYLPQQMMDLVNGNLDGIKEQLSSAFYPGRMSMGMRLSVWCAEEFPFVSQQIVERERTAYPMIEGFSPAVFKKEVCDCWRVDYANEQENQPVQSDIPVLLINGSYDSQTPLKWAQQMLPNLPKAHSIVFNGWGHTPITNWGNPCAMKSAQAFFNDPGKQPELDCMKEIRPNFVVK